jgi:hypothetical protein
MANNPETASVYTQATSKTASVGRGPQFTLETFSVGSPKSGAPNAVLTVAE